MEAAYADFSREVNLGRLECGVWKSGLPGHLQLRECAVADAAGPDLTIIAPNGDVGLSAHVRDLLAGGLRAQRDGAATLTAVPAQETQWQRTVATEARSSILGNHANGEGDAQ